MRCVTFALRRLDRSLTSFRKSTSQTLTTRALSHARYIRLQEGLLRGSFVRPKPYHNVSRTTQLQLRSLCDIPSILLPPVVFAGLLVVLWTWKCFMMVLFQNKIIYMPFLPPNARQETITDYASQCSGVKWIEERISSGDNTKISLCITVLHNFAAQSASEGEVKEKTVLYFQGNASSLPPRLPFLTQVLSLIQSSPSSTPTRYTFIALSYRGYWTSSGRATEHGIHLDCLAALQYAITSHQAHHPNKPMEKVIWGQSIGSAFAAHLAASIASTQQSPGVQLKGLILETPFTSAADMLVTLYPQKWLPYRYLSPFLWNRLDTLGSLERLAEARKEKGKQIKVTILEGGKDELVRKEHSDDLEKRGKEIGLDVRRVVVEGALHTGVLAKNSGRVEAANAIRGDHYT